METKRTRGIRRKPDAATLERLILVEKMTVYQVADHLGYKDGGWANVYRYCRQYGIKPDGIQNAGLRRVDFTPEQMSFVYGSLLGDAYLGKHGEGRYRLSFHHSVKQLAYLQWKSEVLSNFVVAETHSTHKMTLPDGSISSAVAFNTIVHPQLTEVHELCYPENKKTVSTQWLDKVDAFALAVWFMDDGSRNKKYGTLAICTNSFSFDEHLIIQSWLDTQWAIKSVIENRRNGKFSIRINASIAAKFLDIVRPFVPAPMLYKLGG